MRTPVAAVLGVVVGLAVGGTAVAVAATSSSVKVCVTGKNTVRSATAKSTCPTGTKERSVAAQGPQGIPGAQGAAGAQGPGSVDFKATFVNGPNLIASLDTIKVWANCNVYGPTFTVWGANSDVGIRVSGIQSLGTAAPATVQTSTYFYLVNPYAESVSAQLSVTDLMTSKSYHLDLYGNRPPSDSLCTYSGQLTP